jgi:hypothetical protein
MNWELVFGGDPQDVTVVTDGVADLDGFICFNSDLVNHPQWRPGMAVLVDHSQLDTSALTAREVDALAEHVSGLGDALGPAICSIVAPDAYTAGVTVVSIKHVDESPVAIRAFASRDEAIEWLREQKDKRR